MVHNDVLKQRFSSDKLSWCNVRYSGIRKQWVVANLSEFRALSDAEWLSTTPAISGPLWLWRAFGVWVLFLTGKASFSEVRGGNSVFDAFFFSPFFSQWSESSWLLSRSFPFLISYSANDTSPTLSCSLEKMYQREFNWDYNTPRPTLTKNKILISGSHNHSPCITITYVIIF